MDNYFWSAKNNAFFPKELQDSYINSGWDLDDCISVSEDVFIEFCQPSNGKVRVADENGMPSWADIPPPSHSELVERAEQEKQRLTDEAFLTVRVLYLKLQAGRKLTPEESATLNVTLDYIDKVSAIDASSAPNIEWPPTIS